MQDLNIDDGDLSDEYDFMDDVEDGGTSRRRTEREPKLKYMNILQGVANRTIPAITIELDDLDVVRRRPIAQEASCALEEIANSLKCSTRKAGMMTIRN
jgi:DNA replication licensing factor MCM7